MTLKHLYKKWSTYGEYLIIGIKIHFAVGLFVILTKLYLLSLHQKSRKTSHYNYSFSALQHFWYLYIYIPIFQLLLCTSGPKFKLYYFLQPHEYINIHCSLNLDK